MQADAVFAPIVPPIGKIECTKCMKDSLGAVLVVMGAIAIIPSAMGVSQGASQQERDQKQEGIFVVQAIILAFAMLAVIGGIIVLSLKTINKAD
jgi:uncharacterized membrane protein YidH (DUF202 family)